MRPFFHDPSVSSRYPSYRRGISQCFDEFIIRHFRKENTNEDEDEDEALFSDFFSRAFLLNSASLFPAATLPGSFFGFVFFTADVTLLAGFVSVVSTSSAVSTSCSAVSYGLLCSSSLSILCTFKNLLILQVRSYQVLQASSYQVLQAIPYQVLIKFFSTFYILSVE